MKESGEDLVEGGRWAAAEGGGVLKAGRAKEELVAGRVREGGRGEDSVGLDMLSGATN